MSLIAVLVLALGMRLALVRCRRSVHGGRNRRVEIPSILTGDLCLNSTEVVCGIYPCVVRSATKPIIGNS